MQQEDEKANGRHVVVVIFHRTSENRADSMEVVTKQAQEAEQRNLLITLRGFVHWSFWLK